ncbi:uncharacterized protein LOC111892131 [Lactuca sativa]|uniref:Uncharacterized protein n=1 Tax=Lactuca sativa TaxID=4236 RepID=A0A9R1XUG8_LACSA|nr:uncharacterized protein LOC111892131 [Lactuca sativa]KAJ0219707.1 hypothetical protein LSAT_V11C200097580 [Lactuca sativa]
MFRSVSSSRVSDDTYYSIYSHSPTSKAVSPALRALALEANELPQYESSSPFSTPSKKDKLGRLRFSEKAVHLIPLVLLLCALVLWFFSNPDIHMPINKELIDTKIKGKTVGQEVATTRLENSLQRKYTEAHKLTTTLGSL